ncbi:MAG: hypothetical protein IJ224_11860 [Lachnospiraceae bacterium]|nr:hypothetical protein [Lachnospiraceae bacterium]
MAINSISNVTTNNVYTNYADSIATKAAESVESKASDAVKSVVYEKSEASSNATYSINKMSQADRSALVEQLKNDQVQRQQSLTDLVSKTLGQQAKSYSLAMNDDAFWRMFADGKVTVTEAAKKQAQEDISEDGYWGVKQTSQRLFDFASALAGDDPKTMQAMQKAMEKGFKEATKTWGKEMPEITGQTKDAADKLFEEYYKSKGILE